MVSWFQYHFLLSEGDSIFRALWENWDNAQVLKELTILLVVLCLYDRIVYNLPEIVAGIVCEAGWAQLFTGCRIWGSYNRGILRDWIIWATCLCWYMVLLFWKHTLIHIFNSKSMGCVIYIDLIKEISILWEDKG